MAQNSPNALQHWLAHNRPHARPVNTAKTSNRCIGIVIGMVEPSVVVSGEAGAIYKHFPKWPSPYASPKNHVLLETPMCPDHLHGDLVDDCLKAPWSALEPQGKGDATLLLGATVVQIFFTQKCLRPDLVQAVSFGTKRASG